VLSLSVENLCAGYGPVQVLNSVSISARQGETVLLLGTNGNGKSTLLKKIAGLVRASSGRILLTLDGAEIDLAKLPSHDIVDLGVSLIPEGRRLFVQLTVEENLLLGAFRKDARPNVKRQLELSYEAFPALREKRHRAAGSLSGGQQQMVAIARAMMADPKLLLVDEPSVGLSPLLVSQMIQRIGELKSEKNLTVIIAEQNYHEATRIADRGYVIVHGEIAYHGDSVADLGSNDVVQALYLGG
jgi:branched-chain amino acid transport system ATP-binding protein